jgi:predicted nucleic acid-binding Zn finger protein
METTKDFLVSFYKKIKNKTIIDKELIEYLDLIYPAKSAIILKVLKQGISKYIYKPSNREIWSVLGEEGEHIIVPYLFCSCRDFYKNVVINQKRNFCKHLLAQIISKVIKSYQETELEDEEFDELLADLKSKF